MQRRGMVMAVAMALGTVACGGGGDDATPAPEEAGTEATAAVPAPSSTAAPAEPPPLSPATTVSVAASGGAFTYHPLLFGDQALVLTELEDDLPSGTNQVISAIGIDGATRWQAPTCPFGGTWLEETRAVAGPTVFVHCEEPEEVVAYAATDGAELWRAPLSADDVTAATDDDVVALITLEELRLLDARTGAVRAEFEVAAEGYVDVAVAGGPVFAALGGQLVALDPADGTELWAVDTDAIRIVADDDAVHALASDGRLQSFDAATGDLRWAQSEPDPRVVSPWLYGVAGGKVLVLEANERVLAFDGATGEAAWSFDDGADGVIDLSVGERLLVVDQAGDTRQASVVDAATGAVLRVDPPAGGRVSIDGDRYAGTPGLALTFTSLTTT